MPNARRWSMEIRSARGTERCGAGTVEDVCDDFDAHDLGPTARTHSRRRYQRTPFTCSLHWIRRSTGGLLPFQQTARCARDPGARQIGLMACASTSRSKATQTVLGRRWVYSQATCQIWGPPTCGISRNPVALRGMIERDYNHPAVFSWVLFNETWGLHTKVAERDQYLPETQRKVVSVYRLTKSLDPTRLVEDNSPCCRRGHTETDLNTWHEYLPGWRWETHVRRLSDSTFAGSPWNFESAWRQARQPMLNSEFGNVWGYEGSTGDVDWSWDYHRAIARSPHPKIAAAINREITTSSRWMLWRFDDRGRTAWGIVHGRTLRESMRRFIARRRSDEPNARPGTLSTCRCSVIPHGARWRLAHTSASCAVGRAR